VDNSVEVRYAGVVVGRGALREVGPDAARGDAVFDTALGAAFVGIADPLPVGTLITLKMGDVVREARVDDVLESAEPSAVGMRVRWGVAAPAARAATSPAPDAASPKDTVTPAVQAPAAQAPIESAAPQVVTVGDSAAVAAGESGPTVAAEVAEEGSGAISAPLSLASPSGDGQHGGGKRRRKRR
jgi:hypothetical protein